MALLRIDVLVFQVFDSLLVNLDQLGKLGVQGHVFLLLLDLLLGQILVLPHLIANQIGLLNHPLVFPRICSLLLLLHICVRRDGCILLVELLLHD